MNIKVSHESPICLLEDSLQYNDYDYALVHLLDQNEDYRKFYERSAVNDRTIYLDNSIFELGDPADWKLMHKWVKRLKPTYYMVPDALEDADKTIMNWSNWHQMVEAVEDESETIHRSPRDSILKGNAPGTIGVVQGKDWNELVQCYKFMSEMADMVAISFDYSYYLWTGTTNIYNANAAEEWLKTLTDETCDYVRAGHAQVDPVSCDICRDRVARYSSGRQAFIDRLIHEKVWNWNKPHHLLGCSLPVEFKHYVNNNVHNIVSIDTSNPVVAAIKGYKYYDGFGLKFKPTEKLADLISYGENKSEGEINTLKHLTDYNTKAFKRLINR